MWSIGSTFHLVLVHILMAKVTICMNSQSGLNLFKCVHSGSGATRRKEGEMQPCISLNSNFLTHNFTCEKVFTIDELLTLHKVSTYTGRCISLAICVSVTSLPVFSFHFTSRVSHD